MCTQIWESSSLPWLSGFNNPSCNPCQVGLTLLFRFLLFRWMYSRPITKFGYCAVQCTMCNVQSRRVLFQSQRTTTCIPQVAKVETGSLIDHPPFLGLQITDQSSPTFVFYVDIRSIKLFLFLLNKKKKFILFWIWCKEISREEDVFLRQWNHHIVLKKQTTY